MSVFFLYFFATFPLVTCTGNRELYLYLRKRAPATKFRVFFYFIFLSSMVVERMKVFFTFVYACTVGLKSRDPRLHVFLMVARVMTFVAHCTLLETTKGPAFGCDFKTRFYVL